MNRRLPLDSDAQFIPGILHNTESIPYRVYKLSVLKRALHACDDVSEMAETVSRYYLHHSVISRVYFTFRRLVTHNISRNIPQVCGFKQAGKLYDIQYTHI